MEPLIVLALNSGSSSLKFGLYRAASDSSELLFEGEAEEIGSPSGAFWYRLGNDGEKRCETVGEAMDVAGALSRLLSIRQSLDLPQPQVIGHRLVHGGASVRDHALITSKVREELEAAVNFAPLHVPAALKLIDECARRLNVMPQVACLDTAFHNTMPQVARTLPLPESERHLNIERFGFHGLSLQSIVDRLDSIPARTVVAHLGGGSSVTALLHGRSVDTTMGLTPAGGIIMGTRSGDLDPGVLLFLMRRGKVDVQRLEHLLDRQSGLLGVSGLSSDMRQLRLAESSNPSAALAIQMFIYQVQKAVSAMAAVLGGIDVLVFTGGIGEHDAPLRDEVAVGLRFLGHCSVIALPSQEEAAMARITAQLCAANR